ncbi:AMP-binding protein [Bacteroidales bacterium OttesenSCG-928-I21]|nr:AMP-binding protein [Bacteroidales bacterium OttesenSCG-928-I21]
MNFRPEIEYQPIGVIKKFQESQLQNLLKYLSQKSKFYSRLFNAEKIDITKIKTLEDLKYIPVTTKEDLQLYNDDFFCVDKTELIDYMTTSGTLSDPTVFAVTDHDLDRLAYNEAISFSCAGGKRGDIFQLMTTIDKRFMAGLAYFLGIRKMGAGIVRVGNGIPELQWDTIKRINPNTIICVPSFIPKIIQYAQEHNIDYKNTSVKKAVCIGENLRAEDFSLNLLGQKIKNDWDIELYSTYASTEMNTTFCECEAGMGGHHHPELIICELLDENNNIVKEGETGELTITTLGVEGMPLLRFKTGDICRFHYEPCPCGRKSMRISPIYGRKNQMIKFKGTTLYPASIFDILDNVDYIENYLMEVYSNDVGMDGIIIYVGSQIQNETILKELKDRFRAKLRVTPEIKFKSISEIRKIQNPEIKRKPIKIIDRRYNT